MEALIVILAISVILIIRYVWDSLYFPRKLTRLEQSFKRGEFETILNVINGFTAVQKKLLPVQWMLARVYFQQSQFVMSLLHLNEIVSGGTFTPEVPALDVHRMLAVIYERTGKNKKAAEEYEEVLKLDPQNLEALTKIGGYYYEQGDSERAKAALDRAYSIDRTNNETIYMLAMINYDQKFYDMSLAYTEQCIMSDSENHKAILLRGKTEFQMKKYAEAKHDLLAVLNISESKMEAGMFLGRIAIEEGDAESAYRFFSESLTLNTNTDEETLYSRYVFSDMLAKTKRFHESLEQLRVIRNTKVTMLDVDDRIASYSKVLSHAVLRDAAEADIGKYVDDVLYKALSKSGYAIIESVIVTKSLVYFSTMKKIGGGAQAYKSCFALDTSLMPMSADDIDRFNTYSKDRKGHNSFFISLRGFGQNVRNSLPAPIELMETDKFEQIVTGKLTL